MELVYRELQIEPTNRCNLHCSICSHSLFNGLKAKDLTFHEFRTIVDKTENLESIFLQGLGEPFLNPELNKMILYASQHGLFVYTTTNANVLNEEIIQGMILAGLNELRISIDTFDDRLYRDIKCGGKLERAINTIKLINQKRRESEVSHPILRLNVVAMKETVLGILDLINMAARFEIIEVSLIPLVVHGEGWATKEHSLSTLAADDLQSLIARAKKLARKLGIELVSGVSTERHPDTVDIEQSVIPKCYHSMYIQSNGDLSPCCNIPLKFGNVFNEEIADIINGEKMRELRIFIQQTKPSCHDCVHFAHNCIK